MLYFISVPYVLQANFSYLYSYISDIQLTLWRERTDQSMWKAEAIQKLLTDILTRDSHMS